MSVVLRPLKESDIEQTLLLFNSVLDELHSDNRAAYASYSEQYSRERIEALLPDPANIFLVVEEKNSQIGFGLGRVYGSIGFLHWIGLRPNKRGGNIGLQMIDYFLHEFKKRGSHKAEVYTYQERPKLKLLYERAGFEETRKLDDHWFHLNVHHMTKRL